MRTTISIDVDLAARIDKANVHKLAERMGKSTWYIGRTRSGILAALVEYALADLDRDIPAARAQNKPKAAGASKRAAGGNKSPAAVRAAAPNKPDVAKGA